MTGAENDLTPPCGKCRKCGARLEAAHTKLRRRWVCPSITCPSKRKAPTSVGGTIVGGWRK